jgi:TetR/AcrR family transcriptional repressor of nem operon
MGHSKAEKAQSRERILDEAGAQIRREGLRSLSVAKLMRRAQLTHGGFYGHFASRSELTVEALRRALRDGVMVARTVAVAQGPPLTFAAYVRGYLSRAHRDAPETGCAIAALATDAARSGGDARETMSESVDGFIAEMRMALGDLDDRRAMVSISTLVGALILARTLSDPERSDALLQTARDRLLEDAAAAPGVNQLLP